MSSTELLIGRLAAFQLKTVHHQDHTEHIERTGQIQKWFKVKNLGDGTFGSVRLEGESTIKELRAVKAVHIRAKARINPSREIHALVALTKAQSPPPRPLPSKKKEIY
jgi:hypothetical protein